MKVYHLIRIQRYDTKKMFYDIFVHKRQYVKNINNEIPTKAI